MPVVPEYISCKCKKAEHYTYRFDWLKNESVNNIKERLSEDPIIPATFNYTYTLKGICLTAKMLTSAKTEEEVAAIWIGAICKPIVDTYDWDLPIYKNAVLFYDAAVDFLRKNFPVWRPNHTSVVPDHTVSYEDLLKYINKRKCITFQDKQSAMNYIQRCALEIMNGCTIVEISSLDDEKLKRKRANEINVRYLENNKEE